jgi:hypothetical protein
MGCDSGRTTSPNARPARNAASGDNRAGNSVCEGIRGQSRERRGLGELGSSDASDDHSRIQGLPRQERRNDFGSGAATAVIGPKGVVIRVRAAAIL